MIRLVLFVLTLANLYPVLVNAEVYFDPTCEDLGDCRRLSNTDFKMIYNTSANLKDAADWLAIQERCEDVKYELHALVESHLFVVAFPGPSTRVGSKCPVLSFEDGGVVGKLVSAYDGTDAESLKSRSFDLDAEAKLSDIVAAFDDAKSSIGNEYSFVKNNCATFVLSMLYRGLVAGQPTTEAVEYVTDSLVATGSRAKILESPDSDELGATDAMRGSASALTRRLVKTYIVNFFREE